ARIITRAAPFHHCAATCRRPRPCYGIGLVSRVEPEWWARFALPNLPLRQPEEGAHLARDLARLLERRRRREIEAPARGERDARLEAVERRTHLHHLEVGDVGERYVDHPARKKEEPAHEAGAAGRLVEHTGRTVRKERAQPHDHPLRRVLDDPAHPS